MIDAYAKFHRRGLRGLRPLLIALATVFGLLLAASPAAARGSLRLANSAPEEDEGTWKLKITIDYGSLPHLAHVPMKFSFKPTVLYERSLTDASPDEPKMRRVPLQNQSEINVPMDVGFADARGEIFKITKFSVKLRRDAGFEAGEYDLVVRLASGGTVGRRQRIKLQGNNKVVDRRSISFAAPKPKPKPKSTTMDTPEPTGPMAAEDNGLDLSDIPDIEDTDDIVDPDAPPPVEPKQGGCGCRVAGIDGQPARRAGWAGLALLAMLLWRRRRE